MTRKDKITIWITTILIFIFSLIGILASIGLLTKKITLVKAEEQEQIYYQWNMPQSISINDMNSLIASNQSEVIFKIGNETSTEGIMYNNNNYNYQYTINKIRLLTYSGNTTRSFEINISSNENDPITRAITIEYFYSNETTQWEYNSETSYIGNQNTEITLQNFLTTIWKKGSTLDNYLTTENLTTKWQLLFDIDIIREVTLTIQLQAPTLTLTNNTLQWNYIENANYYNVFMNGNLIGQTEWNTWATIQNGTYTVQACTNDTENYSNSEISNTVIQNNYNDLVGNGVNWFTFFSAFVDSQIFLIKSLLNYTIWDINFFQLFCFIITIGLAIMIIKFIKGW